ncbi:TonB-dependent receptor [Roseateles koreensis]|uniref:TonB-dependent receptor n=1 Tax=Roseateles koreensis TaxID=2987526 RepID=A0ABT5KVW9_9BURK|nr:TonB-dependent receptor [Roseateles koreensis]MDC8786931.1 TonB-dependent receptor [Roseateles koreensis]
MRGSTLFAALSDALKAATEIFMQTTLFARRPLAVGASLLCLSFAGLMAISVQAEPNNPPPGALSASSSGASAEKLDRVVLTGNPLQHEEQAQAVDVLEGDALILRRASTLGETLDGLPGVASSYFGPNSNRPTIRGLDGDRIRMLSNSGASVDASSLSFDHAIPIDPLVIDRVEVLRGAGALLYGGNAIGGVVNTLDNRIPRKLVQGVGGAAEFRLGGAANERNGALVLDGGSAQGQSGWAWHADFAARSAGDQATPSFTSVDGLTDHVRNSAANSHGGALGGSYVFAHGYVGVSLDDYRNDYGVTVEPDVKINMQRQRVATAGEWRAQAGDGQALLQRVTWQLSRSDYEHKEIEGSGAVGTMFKSTGTDLRVEAQHGPLGPVHGLVGVQWDQSNFSALGAEALVPSSRTENGALFVLEELDAGPLALSVGARAESVRIDADGDAAGVEAKFGAPLLSKYQPHSFSLSASYQLPEVAQGLSLSANLNSTERAPMFYELHANGVHVASGAYERGDINLGLEKANGLDFGVQWKASGNLLRLNVYRTKFSSYIALAATGEQLPQDGGSTLPVYAFKSVPALLQGFELEGRWSVPATQLAAVAPGALLTLSAQLDGVRGTNEASGEPLPRLAPLRASFTVEAQQGPWSGRVEWHLVARQDRVPALDTPTAGYGMLKASIARQFMLGQSDALWYLKLDNLTNRLAYSATSVPTIRDLSPLPGRSLHAGIQIRF